MSQPELTSRERMLLAFKRQEVDYVPCCAYFNPLAPELRHGHSWRFPWSSEASLDDRLEYQTRRLGLDQLVDVELGLCRPDPRVTSRTWREKNVLHKAFMTSSGELHAAVSRNELWPHGEDIPLYSDFNVGHFIEPWIKTESDLACLTHILRVCDTQEALAEARSAFAKAKRSADRYGLATLAEIGMGLTGAQQLFGATGLCVMTLDRPELVHAYLEHEHRINLRTIAVAGEVGVDIVMRNGFYESSDFYGPRMLDEFVGGRIRREADAIRASGMVAAYTIHTGIMPILDYLATLTVDSFFGIDIAFHNPDLRAVRAALAANKSFWTGPSSTFHLWKGPEPTRQAVRQVFDSFGKRGLILGPCVSAHSIMPWESTLAMIDEWKKLR